MKPLLIIPPAPARWPALRDLLADEGDVRLADLERRIAHGLPGAQDAYAVILSGGLCLSVAGINKYGDLGVLGPVYTRPDHRRRGYARQVTETVLSWFEMTGGKWLYLTTTDELDEGLYWKFGFAQMHRAEWAPHNRLMMLRVTHGVTSEPLADATGPVTVRDVTRVEWPAMVALLQYRPGPDPRVPLAESAVTAEAFTLDLLSHQDKGSCQLKGAFCGPRLTALASLAIDQPGSRTYAMLIPHSDGPPELRDAILELARSRGYTQVDFPMETLVRPS
jgi:GNAT superfamily N-acetyltransferase